MGISRWGNFNESARFGVICTAKCFGNSVNALDKPEDSRGFMFVTAATLKYFQTLRKYGMAIKIKM